MKKKLLLCACAVILGAYSVEVHSSSNSVIIVLPPTETPVPTATPTVTPAPAVDPGPVALYGSYDADISDGHYIGGVDIPVGTYNLSLVSGSGNVYSPRSINEIFRSGEVESYRNFKVYTGTNLSVSSGLTIHIHSDSVDVSTLKPRTIYGERETILGAGMYTAGVDFPAGTYHIRGYNDSGNVYSHGADINEIISVDPKEGHSIYQFSNAKFEDGDELEVSGCTIILAPVGE